MARQLTIIRHAKSDWSFQVSDFDRPLNDRGFRDAPLMARQLAAESRTPQGLVSSPAKRAITTAEIFADVLGHPSKLIKVDERIYEASIQELLSVIGELDDRYESVALFGHNPGLSGLIAYLSGNDYLDIPTCAVVCLDFYSASSWTEISGNTGHISRFMYPKDFL